MATKLTIDDFSTDDVWLYYDIERKKSSSAVNNSTYDEPKFIRVEDGLEMITYISSKMWNKKKGKWNTITQDENHPDFSGGFGPFGLFRGLSPVIDGKVKYSSGGNGPDIVANADFTPERLQDDKNNIKEHQVLNAMDINKAHKLYFDIKRGIKKE
jgi:hypothetical protein